MDDNAPRAGSEKLMEVLDQLNAKGGRGRCNFAGEHSATVGDEERNAASVHYQYLDSRLSSRYTSSKQEVRLKV
ncbi:DUF4113 domain-containing protein [Salmonella enterica subsp. enterica]|nr:DUF4113 domain-containing protein [Salmonella enterica subsp. enterica]